MKIKIPSLSTGTYSLTCASKGESVKLKDASLKVYKADETSVTGVYPSRVPTKTNLKLMMHGKGFVQTGKFDFFALDVSYLFDFGILDFIFTDIDHVHTTNNLLHRQISYALMKM